MTSAQDSSAELSVVITQYESLRRAAIGGALPCEARAGLLLFLHRGMYGWARALATMRAPQHASGSRPPNWKAPEEHRAVIHIFAAMAIKANHQGAAP
jgi:hypothetical protein